MNSEPNLSKQLAAVLKHAYCRTIEAREAVEHRICSIPGQEKIVKLWEEQLDYMIAKNYPGYDADSYPVTTRRSRETEKLERYRGELPERLAKYSNQLKELERLSEEVRKMAIFAKEGNSFTTPWPKIPDELKNNPWPVNWPVLDEKSQYEKEKNNDRKSGFIFEKNNTLFSSIYPSTTVFEMNISGNIVSLEARYPGEISAFKGFLYDYLDCRISSRWRAIEEAQRSGIRWPKLDQYLSECENPWLPEDFVCERFGLRGTISYREDLADIMAKISVETGRRYFQLQQGSYRISHNAISYGQLNELINAGLARWGGHMELSELVREIPFPEWKSIFTLSRLPTPRSFAKVQEKFQELVSKRGMNEVQNWMHKFFQPSDVFELLDPPGYDHEDFLGIRARANVMVSALIRLGEGSSEPLCILRWT